MVSGEFAGVLFDVHDDVEEFDSCEAKDERGISAERDGESSGNSHENQSGIGKGLIEPEKGGNGYADTGQDRRASDDQGEGGEDRAIAAEEGVAARCEQAALLGIAGGRAAGFDERGRYVFIVFTLLQNLRVDRLGRGRRVFGVIAGRYGLRDRREGGEGAVLGSRRRIPDD